MLISCSAQKGKVSRKTQEKLHRAVLHFQVNELDEAEDICLSLIKKYPEYVRPRDLLAQINMARGQFRKGINQYLKILDTDSTYYLAAYELGRLYFSMSQYDSALIHARWHLRSTDTKPGRIQESEKVVRDALFCLDSPPVVEFNPVNLGPKINSVQEEYFPGLTVDESQLFFTRRDGRRDIRIQNEDLFVSKRYEDEWLIARNLGGPINTPENEGAFTTSADGRYLFFTSCRRPNGIGSCDLWISVLKEGRWTEPFNIGEPVNSPSWETQPSLSADGKTLFFVSSRPGGEGGSDIYYSRFNGKKGWTEPINLGPTINTSDDEQFPFIHPDGKTLYFSSEGHPGFGGSDLFISRLQDDGSWSEPVNLGNPINTSKDEWNLIVDRTGKMAFFSSNGIEGGYGGMDIYRFELPKEVTAEEVTYVKATILDEETKEPISANAELVDLVDPTQRTEAVSLKSNGTFIITLKGGRQYAMNVSADGYLFHTEHFTLPKGPLKTYEITVLMKKPKAGESIVLRNIFFETDSYDLKAESNVELDKLIRYLEQNPELRIEIGGHTDNVGTSSYNLTLSQNRADAVKQYLIDNGIDTGRLVSKGYGDTQPIDDNQTEEGRANNRRTEIKVL
jgi:outer membrane protein OmpA-like peptidoglycan-associated protein